MNQRSCAAVAVDGYTLASHVAFVRNGIIVDDTTLSLFASINDALKGLAAAVEQIEARLVVVEDRSYKLSDWEKIMLDLGFKQ